MLQDFLFMVFNGFQFLQIEDFGDMGYFRVKHEMLNEEIVVKFCYLEEEEKTMFETSYIRGTKWKFAPDCQVETILNYITKELIEEAIKRLRNSIEY